MPEVILCLEALGIEETLGFRFEISDKVPDHCGLGWRTQLRLAIAASLATLLNVPISRSQLPPRLGRGGTSGVGSWGFWTGGFIVDGGHDRSVKQRFAPSSAVAGTVLPPLLYHSDFPWHVVIALHRDSRLVYGIDEQQHFAANTPTPDDESLRLEQLIYYDLPSAVEQQDFAAFTRSLDEVRGLGFNKVESKFRGESSGIATNHLQESGLKGVSMSSWGPIYFGFSQEEQTADQAVKYLKETDAFGLVRAPAISQGATVSINGGLPKPLLTALEVSE